MYENIDSDKHIYTRKKFTDKRKRPSMLSHHNDNNVYQMKIVKVYIER